MSITLQELRTQRQYRQDKRKHLIKRFQTLQTRSTQQPKQIASITKQTVNDQSNQYKIVLSQNIKYKTQLLTLLQTPSPQVLGLEQKLSQLKGGFKDEMDGLIQLAKQQKNNQRQKLQTMFKQIKQQISKNKELRSSNIQIQQWLLKSNQERIESQKTDYQAKLLQYQNRLQQSNKVVSDFENQLNSEQMIDKALNKQEVISAMIEQGKQEFKQIITTESYQIIMKQKDEIIRLLLQKSKAKQEQVGQIKQLVENYQSVFEKLNTQKELLVQDNKDKAKQMFKIKQIFTKLLAQREAQAQANEEQQEEQIQEQCQYDKNEQSDQ